MSCTTRLIVAVLGASGRPVLGLIRAPAATSRSAGSSLARSPASRKLLAPANAANTVIVSTDARPCRIPRAKRGSTKAPNTSAKADTTSSAAPCSWSCSGACDTDNGGLLAWMTQGWKLGSFQAGGHCPN